jgi:hypothetical protein
MMRPAPSGDTTHLAASVWLCLQVAHLNLPGSELFRKLRQLKSEKGGLTSQDERHFAQLRRSLEAEVLAHADVVSSVGQMLSYSGWRCCC